MIGSKEALNLNFYSIVVYSSSNESLKAKQYWENAEGRKRWTLERKKNEFLISFRSFVEKKIRNVEKKEKSEEILNSIAFQLRFI